MAVSAWCFFLMVPWAGQQYVIVVFPGHTHLFFAMVITIPGFNYYYSLMDCENELSTVKPV